MYYSPVIAVKNHSSVVTDAEVEVAVYALQRQVSYHFKPSWNAGCHLYAGDPIANAWVIAILDDSDQAGALGYHDTTATGRPLAKVFAKTDKENGLSWTVTTSHELLEMLADPYCSLASQVTDTTFYAVEVCDPVERDEDGYYVAGIHVSNFITPQWFIRGLPTGTHYDRCGLLTAPLSLHTGGYCSIFVSGTGWQQRDAFGELVALDPDDARFRSRG
jgi:hypothetical protein